MMGWPGITTSYRHCIDIEWRLRQLALFPPLFKVQSGLDAPPDAFVSVRYRKCAVMDRRS